MVSDREYIEVVRIAKTAILIAAVDGKLSSDLRTDIILAALHYIVVSTRCDTLMSALEWHTGENKVISIEQSVNIMIRLVEELVKEMETAGTRLSNLMGHAAESRGEKVES
jgi:hypothetical protein